MKEEGFSRSSEKTRAMEEITKKSSDREMKGMFGMTDSGTESDTSVLSKEVREEHSCNEPARHSEEMPGHDLLLPHIPPAAVASFQDRTDMWTQQGQSLKSLHFVPRLVTFMPANSDCPIGPERLDDRRRTSAINTQQGLTVDRADSWRDEDNKYHHPFEHNSNRGSSDGDYHPCRWTGWTEFRIWEDCAPATQWTGERLMLECCCGPQSRIGNPKNFVDNSC
eukprot:6234375-Pyramimonas_sp.AAC.1